MQFQIAGKLRRKPTDNGFKQVQTAYQALISNLDKLVLYETLLRYMLWYNTKPELAKH